MLIKIGVGLLAATSGVLVAGVVALAQFGFAMVNLESDELTLHLPVPLAIVGAGVQFMPEEDLAKLQRELQPYLPLVEAVLKDLEALPDAELVDIRNREEWVRVTIERGRLRIRVEPGPAGQDEKVDITVPVSGLRKVLHTVSD